jgi:hypothetical protein
MYATQEPWVALYHRLMDYDGGDAYADILAPWVEAHADERRWLAEIAARGEDWGGDAAEDLCRLYAANRVASVLLLRFQEGDRDWEGPPIAVDGYRRFHEAMGFRVPEAGGFHPFHHEIVGVRQADDPDAPVAIVEERWPPLMLGEMMFCRGGVVVSAGTEHVMKEIAEGSTLFWASRRRDRPCADLSHGWGSNSQWRTPLRRDYATPDGFRYNVDGKESLNGRSGTVDGISVAAMIEVVRHRCLVRTSVDDADLFPYLYSYTETRPG